jgi:hypothetical protein
MRDRLASFRSPPPHPGSRLFRLHRKERIVTRRRGGSLVELVVALLLLELVGAAALAAALAADRIGRRAARGATADRERWETYRQTELARPCRGDSVPRASALLLPATPERASFAVTVRCGP